MKAGIWITVLIGILAGDAAAAESKLGLAQPTQPSTTTINHPFGGYANLLEKINTDASYPATKANAIKSLSSIPDSYVLEFSQYTYSRYLKSKSESDHTGILEIISPIILSSVVETVMLSASQNYDFLVHEFYFAKTPQIEFRNPSGVFDKVSRNVKNDCELEVWNAIFIAKHMQKTYRFVTSCNTIKKATANKRTFTRKQLLDIYYTFRDIDGY